MIHAFINASGRFALAIVAGSLLAMLLGCSPSHPPSAIPIPAESSDRAQADAIGAGIDSFLERYLEAYGSGDVDRLRPFYRDDSLIWANARETVTGWPQVNNMFQPSFERFAIDGRINLFEVIELGDHAFLRFVTDVTLTPYDGGEPFTLHFRDFALLARDSTGDWYIARNIDQPVERALRDADLAVPADGVLKIIEAAVPSAVSTEGE